MLLLYQLIGKRILYNNISVENFSIMGREVHNITRTIKEAMYIRVNDQSPNRTIGKFQLMHKWDEVLLNPISISPHNGSTPPSATQGAGGYTSLHYINSTDKHGPLLGGSQTLLWDHVSSLTHPLVLSV